MRTEMTEPALTQIKAMERNQPQLIPQLLGPVLSQLLGESRQMSDALIHGHHRRKRAGFGTEFWQFRDHAPHDPLRSIDWKRSARNPQKEQLTANGKLIFRPHLLVRKLEKETTQAMLFGIKISADMDWRSEKTTSTKFQHAVKLLFALGYALERGGESLGWLDSPKLFTGPGALERMLRLPTRSWPTAFQNSVRAGRNLILFSDGLDSVDLHAQLVKHFRALRSHIIFILIEDPAERDFPYSGRVKLHAPGNRTTESEDTGSILIGRAEKRRADYLRHRGEHLAKLKNLFVQSGFNYCQLATDGDIAEHASKLASCVRKMQRQGR